MLKTLAIALFLVPAVAFAQAPKTGLDSTGFYAMPVVGLSKRPDSDTRGNLNTAGGPISGNAITQFEDLGWLVGGEVGVKLNATKSISIRVGPSVSYSQNNLAELRTVNAAFGAGPSATFLGSFPLEGTMSTLQLGLNTRVGWENESIVTPHMLVRFGARRTTFDIDRFAGVTINDSDHDWNYSAGAGLGMAIALTDSMAIMVEGAVDRSIKDPRVSINTPAGVATIDYEDWEFGVITGLVISF